MQRIYETRIANAKKLLNDLRTQIEDDYKPFIMTKALSFGKDMCSTQSSLYCKDREEPAGFNDFKDFVYALSDQLGIELTFEIFEGKFEWI